MKILAVINENGRKLTVFLYQAVLQQELEEIDAIRAKRFSQRRFAIAIPDIHLLQELTHPTKLAIAKRCCLQQIVLKCSAK